MHWLHRLRITRLRISLLVSRLGISLRGISGLLVLTAIIVGGRIAGLVGILLAVPAAAILDYLSTHAAGPMGVILMDYAGVDQSEGYEVKGAQLVQAIIDNNCKYLDDGAMIKTVKQGKTEARAYTLGGVLTNKTGRGIRIVDGKKLAKK